MNSFQFTRSARLSLVFQRRQEGARRSRQPLLLPTRSVRRASGFVLTAKWLRKIRPGSTYMISGMFPAGLKPGFNLAMMGQILNGFAAMLWGQLYARQSYGFSRPRCGQQLKRPNRRTATTTVARIWVRGGKVMGFVATEYIRTNLRTRELQAEFARAAALAARLRER